jgi:hypothetical protein
MSPYDPQRSRHRPSPTDDEPAPVDALLEPQAPEPTLPEGVELEVTDAGGAVLHTADADVEVTAQGDDVVVHTADADVEVRAEDDEVVIAAGGEEIYVDTSPRRADDELSPFAGPPVVAARGRSRLVAALVAALVTVLLVLLWNRRRRR